MKPIQTPFGGEARKPQDGSGRRTRQLDTLSCSIGCNPATIVRICSDADRGESDVAFHLPGTPMARGVRSLFRWKRHGEWWIEDLGTSHFLRRGNWMQLASCGSLAPQVASEFLAPVAPFLRRSFPPSVSKPRKLVRNSPRKSARKDFRHF